MITSGRRAKRADGTIYRQIRRQRVAGNILWDARSGGRTNPGNLLQLAGRSLRFLLKFVRPRG
jgi:hypothetical protein